MHIVFNSSKFRALSDVGGRKIILKGISTCGDGTAEGPVPRCQCSRPAHRIGAICPIDALNERAIGSGKHRVGDL
jgi:hypothetical protein